RRERRGRRRLEGGDHSRALPLESDPLASGNRIATMVAERRARIALHAVHEHLEMEVRAGRESGRAHVRDGLPDFDARAHVDARRESAEMAVPRYKSIPVTKLEHVAVPVPPPSADDDTVADGAHRRSERRRVVSALVLLPDTEDGMI